MGANSTSPLEYEQNRFASQAKSYKEALQQAREVGFKNIVELKLATWSRESHGLFDYENK